MITIALSGPRGDTPELANAIAHLVAQDGKSVLKVENGSVPVVAPDRNLDVLIIISQEE